MPETIDASRKVVIENVEPELDCGRYAVKREVGDTITVRADIFKEGHDAISAAIWYRPEDEETWQESRMKFWDNDRWEGAFTVDRNCRWYFTVVAWTDTFGTWQSDLRKKYDAGQEVLLELFEGAQLLAAAAIPLAEGPDRDRLMEFLREVAGDEQLASGGLIPRSAWAQFRDDVEGGSHLTVAERVAAALDPALLELMSRYPLRNDLTRFDRELPVQVDRVAARFAAWYELFPRSMSDDESRHGTFDDVIRKLPYVQSMGFDVLYFPPIHPIGFTFRKGKNNTLNPGPDEPGVPYAVGSDAGGHKAVHPELGTLEDFRRLVAAAREHGLEIALDFAIQVSPDHPYAKEHPGWFYIRPDGTIMYAENPPKKYQDIYPLNFYGDDWESQWAEWRDVILHWVEQGVHIFRVDNPHTKPVQFWEWMIREVQREHPQVIFLSEAFTRPKMMRALAKAGFSQSYTYFTWRNFKGELTEYFTELTQGPMKEYFRGNLFPNTPDINPEFLQRGGRPAHMIRAILATTLSSVYGIYSGFELCEATPLAPGKEEYLDSEKYQVKAWDWDRPGNIRPLITRLNEARRQNPALQEYDNLRFYPADNDNVLFYGKMTEDRTSMVFVAVNLDPFATHETMLHFPLPDMGIGWSDPWEVEELLTGERFFWHGGSQWVRLEPDAPGRIFRVRAWRSSEHGFDYFMEPTLV
ncbi:alpha-1,4-glucan--maltose-1-phosphate maltosyltransferase [Longimicrobium sp.]|uniref:alpha-1,4-glucan--maltose-1-phosphate maltosyltransferase n=1 Tax=Longimicrobium sp. TaxID=2029185 RepID=UPI002E33ACC9|nr:alpha-1,4-glucan--maltose-1-phosphate maltosyltransferase [Longimicrobium sp.]HEX6036482.1 alpha-1,4-glucan--maltose-1-phosphate maltosyltransferase [Longimicrobium sp.]